MITERINYMIGGAAIFSPAWLPKMAEVSTVASQLLPVFGCALVLLQIFLKLIERK